MIYAHQACPKHYASKIKLSWQLVKWLAQKSWIIDIMPFTNLKKKPPTKCWKQPVNAWNTPGNKNRMPLHRCSVASSANQVLGNDLSNHKVMWHQYGTQLGLENCWSWFRFPFSRTSLHKNHDLMRPLAVAHSTQAFQSYTEMKSDLGSFGASSGFATKRKWPKNTNTNTHLITHHSHARFNKKKQDITLGIQAASDFQNVNSESRLKEAN